MQKIQEHWAVAAIPKETKEYALRGEKEAMAWLVTAYEVAATETADSNKNLFISAMQHSFDQYIQMGIPEKFRQKALYVLRLCSMAYCGDKIEELKEWYRNNKTVLWKESLFHTESDDWYDRLLKTTYRCWLRLFMENPESLWENEREIQEICLSQEIEEEKYLEHVKDLRKEMKTLCSFYHLIKAADLLSYAGTNRIYIKDRVFEHITDAIYCAEKSDCLLWEAIRWMKYISNSASNSASTVK